MQSVNLQRFDINTDRRLSVEEIAEGIDVVQTEIPSPTTKEGESRKLENTKKAADIIAALAKLLPDAMAQRDNGGVELPAPMIQRTQSWENSASEPRIPTALMARVRDASQLVLSVPSGKVSAPALRDNTDE